MSVAEKIIDDEERVFINAGTISNYPVSSPTIIVLRSGALTITQSGKTYRVSAPNMLVLNSVGMAKIEANEYSVFNKIVVQADEAFVGRCGGRNYIIDVGLFKKVVNILKRPVEIGLLGRFVLFIGNAGEVSSTTDLNILVEMDGYAVFYRINDLNTIVPGIFDVVVIGAGPAGISVGAQCKSIGLKTLVLGEPLSFWKRHILPLPLRSPMGHTNIETGHGTYKYLDFAREKGLATTGRIEFENFVAYYDEVVQKSGVNILRLYARKVLKENGNWVVVGAGNQKIAARNIVVATGLQDMKRIPREFAELSHIRCFHASDCGNLAVLKGKTVAVIGAGQSALELATESAGRAEKVWVVHRNSGIKYRSLHSPGNSLFKLLFKYSDLYFPYLPEKLRRGLLKYLLKGTAEPSIQNDVLRPNLTVVNNAIIDSAREIGEKVHIKLKNGDSISVDYVIVGSGYEYNIKRINFLEYILASGSIDHIRGWPVLSKYFESTVKGLFFVGYPCVSRIGPKAQFIFGTSIYTKNTIMKLAKNVVE